MDSKASVPEDAALTGKIALVTGGAQGIGRAIAEVFQQAGMCVCLVDCDTLAGEASAAELTGSKGRNPVVFIPADLAQTRDIDFAVSAFAERFGRIDVLVNNAAVELDKPFAEISSSDWDRVQAINLRAPFLMTQQLVPYFPANGGSVINVSSIHASHAFPNSIAYASSKGGLVSLTRNLSLELGPGHIRVNALCPGYIDTRLWEEYLRSASDADLLATQVAALHPLGRRGRPADVAGAALFLASNGSAFITGTQLVVDGGLTVRAHP